jgi:transcription elongation factor GreA-like protein
LWTHPRRRQPRRFPRCSARKNTVSSSSNEDLSQFGVDAPIPILVGLSQVRSCNIASDTHVVKMLASTQVCFDVSETVAKSYLSENHAEELVSRRKTPTRPLHRKAFDAARKFFWIERVRDLTENDLAKIHSLIENDAA